MKKNHQKLWKVLTIVFAAFLVVCIVADVVTNYFFTSVNAFLLADTYRIVDDGDGSDTEYFPDEWAGYDDWFSYYEEDLCARTEAEGAVLLKNENAALPLGENAKVSLFSHSSVEMIYGGTGSGSVNTSTAPNLRKALESAGAQINTTLWTFYNTGNGSSYKRKVPALSSCAAKGDYSINEVPWNLIEKETGLTDTFASFGDAAIFVLARSGGEGLDLAITGCTDEGTDGDYLALSTNEKDTLKALKTLKDNGTFKKIIVLLNSSNALNCAFLDDPAYDIDAALWIGGVGAYGNNAVAEILTGSINPSGRLVDTYLTSNAYNPSLLNFADATYPNAAEMGLTETNDDLQTNVNYVVYQEGIYVGYKYFETRYEDQVMGTGNTGDYDYASQVYRTFGYGQSYTDFAYGDFKVTEDGDHFTVSVAVTNQGAVAGKHVVEVYMQKPYTEYDRQQGIEKAAVELAGFAKTRQLGAGQSEIVTIDIPKELMKSYDAQGEGTYIVDAGDYYLTVGTDAHNAVNNILCAKGYTPDQGMDEAGNAALTFKYTQKDLDSKTYSVSAATGEAIVNQFDNVDLNRYSASETKVTYLSRSDWSGTYPTATTVVRVTEQMAKDIANEYVAKTEDENGNPYTMPTYNANNGMTLAMMMGLSYDDPAWEKLLDQMSFSEQEDIVINAFHNTKAANSISKPATVETNGPQGITDSFFGGKKSGTAYPAEVIMAATWNRDIMTELGDNIGTQGLKTHTNGVYAPAANIHRNAYSGRNYEYFSEDAFLSGAMMAPEIKAIQDKGVYVFMKHFALNDQETHRAGVMVWANEQAIREAYLAAYAPSVTESHAKGAMTVMNRIGTQWGGACRSLLTNVLRNEWGFDGIVITDYSSNSNFTVQTAGLIGGADLWDGFRASDISDKQNDPYIAQLLRQAIHRILYVQVNSSAMNGISSTARVVPITTWWQIAEYSATALFGVLTILSAVLWVVNKKKAPKKA
ncbi:MAG: glycoside hydrolase family 3 protein [Clostridia bacterium]|nr:glycoside hydrolase family 3 protein [Clostridia bacterium]